MAILLRNINQNDFYTVAVQNTRIPIQQGLVNNDPDVDAIFRLTHEQEITFNDQQKPISLPAKTMCPFNSQNTLFYYSAFWGLLLPITTSFRVCDIWRSYWVQRMLWDMHASLCFLPPTAIQYRNDHDLLKDFTDEIEMYLHAERFIKSLGAWHSDKTDFIDRMQDLMYHMIDQHFFKSPEMELLKAWLHDLNQLGYTMPLMS